MGALEVTSESGSIGDPCPCRVHWTKCAVCRAIGLCSLGRSPRRVSASRWVLPSRSGLSSALASHISLTFSLTTPCAGDRYEPVQCDDCHNKNVVGPPDGKQSRTTYGGQAHSKFPAQPAWLFICREGLFRGRTAVRQWPRTSLFRPFQNSESRYRTCDPRGRRSPWEARRGAPGKTVSTMVSTLQSPAPAAAAGHPPRRNLHGLDSWRQP